MLFVFHYLHFSGLTTPETRGANVKTELKAWAVDLKKLSETVETLPFTGTY